MTFLIEHWRLMGFRRAEGTRSSSCNWWERAHSQIVVWCVIARIRWHRKVVTVARHLGSNLGEKASFAHDLQLWYESRVSWRLKRRFLIGRVVNTALTGSEASCPSKTQGDGRGSGEKGRSWACPHNVQQGGTAFLEIGAL